MVGWKIGAIVWLTSKGSRHILGRNCQKLTLLGQQEKNAKKKLFFKIQLWNLVLNFFEECVENILETLTIWIERL